MKHGLFILLFVICTAPAWAQDRAPQGDFGEVFGLARSGSTPVDCEKPEPLPQTRAQWEAVATKIESGQVNKATTDAFISGKMPIDLHTEALGRKFNAAHTDYIKRKIENPLTGCDRDGYAEVFGMYRVGGVDDETENDYPLPSTEELNAIWASILAETEKQQESQKPKTGE